MSPGKNCCYDPSRLICGSVPNGTTDMVLSCWIIYTYVCWALWVLFICVLLATGHTLTTYELVKAIFSIIGSFIGLLIQQISMWALMNVYQRIQNLEGSNADLVIDSETNYDIQQ